LVFLALFAALYFFFFRTSEQSQERKIQVPELKLPEGQRPEPAFCDLWTDEFRSRISTRGGVLVHFSPLTAKYKKLDKELELVTTPDHPNLGPLFASFRSAADLKREKDWLVQTDIQDFQIVESKAKTCTLVADDGRARIEKTFKPGATPYSISLTVKVTNLTDQSKPYALSVGTGHYL